MDAKEKELQMRAEIEQIQEQIEALEQKQNRLFDKLEKSIVSRSPIQVGDKVLLSQQYPKTFKQTLCIVTSVRSAVKDGYEHTYSLSRINEDGTTGDNVCFNWVKSLELVEKAAYRK